MKTINRLLLVWTFLFFQAGTAVADKGQVFINLTTDDQAAAAQALETALAGLESRGGGYPVSQPGRG